MNEVLTLDQEARSILREVLNEKDLAIEQLTRQIIQYQTQLTNFEEKFQSLQRTQALTIDQHNIEALMNAGFIKNENSQFHILIDITQIIHQKLDVVKLDSKIQIIKEVNNANPSVSKQFTDAYELLRNQNNILLKQMSEKDKEYESIINSLKDAIKKSKEEHEKAVAELQSKIEKIQEEKEIIQMETDQIVEEKNGLNHFITELRDKYQQKLKQCQQHVDKISELTLKNESLMKQNKELGAQSAILKKSNQQIIEEQKQMKQKYQELEYEYNKFVTSSQDNDSFIKQRQLESINNKKQIKLLQERIKSLDEQCRTLKTQNQRYINQMKKFEGYQVLPSVENIAQSQFKVAASPERQKPKQKRKGKKLIRIGY